jgi:hypothetical protein
MSQEGSSMILSAPPVPLTTIEYNLSALGIPDREIRGLLSHSEFPLLQFRSHQICFLHDYPCNRLNRPLNTTELSTVFEVRTAVIRRILRKRPESPQPPGRHQALDPAIESAIVTLVLDAFKNGRGMTPKKLLQMVRDTYNPKLTKGWVHSFIGRHLDVLPLCRSLPHEDTRMTVPRACLEQNIATMKTHIVGKFSELIFNLDEVGS